MVFGLQRTYNIIKSMYALCFELNKHYANKHTMEMAQIIVGENKITSTYLLVQGIYDKKKTYAFMHVQVLKEKN